MREILFKAKRLDNGEWVEGYFCGGTCDAPLRKEIRKCAMIIEEKTLWWFEVDPETVCQYTGLKDKNGVKIFEGDIIQRDWLGYIHKYKVDFCNLRGAFIGESLDECGGYTSFYNDGEMFEVIGNIHDKEEADE